MKKSILSLLFILTSVQIFSQTNADLDLKYGFKKFRFGMAPSEIDGIKRDENLQRYTSVVEYIYIKNDIRTINNVDITEIRLFFFKNRLYKIDVSFGSPMSEYTSTDQILIDGMLKTNYGQPVVSFKNQFKGKYFVIATSVWEGMKVKLEHTRVNLKPDAKDSYNRIIGYMVFIEKRIAQEQTKSELL